MKTFKQMNEDIQHQMQLNEKGLLKKLKRVKDAAVNAFKDSPEKHAEKMKNVANRAAKQDADHADAKANLSKNRKSNAKELSNLKHSTSGYNITKKPDSTNPNANRGAKHGSFFDTTALHNPNNTGRMDRGNGDYVDRAGNTRANVEAAGDHQRGMSHTRIAARANRLNDEKDKDRRRLHGPNEADDRVNTIKKHTANLKKHAPEAKDRIAHAENTLKLHKDAHNAAGVHLQSHKVKEYTTSHEAHYHEHHYGNGAEDHHYEKMEKHKEAEQNNPGETHINDKKLGYGSEHYDHPHHEEERTADYAGPAHGVSFHRMTKAGEAAHGAYNKMVDSQKNAEAGLPAGGKSKTKFHKKSAYEKVDIAANKEYHKKAISKVTGNGNEIVKGLKHINKDEKQKEMDV